MWQLRQQHEGLVSWLSEDCLFSTKLHQIKTVTEEVGAERLELTQLAAAVLHLQHLWDLLQL